MTLYILCVHGACVCTYTQHIHAMYNVQLHLVCVRMYICALIYCILVLCMLSVFYFYFFFILETKPPSIADHLQLTGKAFSAGRLGCRHLLYMSVHVCIQLMVHKSVYFSNELTSGAGLCDNRNNIIMIFHDIFTKLLQLAELPTLRVGNSV